MRSVRIITATMAMTTILEEGPIKPAPVPASHIVRIANPAPLGLCGFELTTFVFSCYNVAIFGISVAAPPNVVAGLAVFYGGRWRGIWEFKTGNTFGATAFTSYGAFWFSCSTIQILGFGVKAVSATAGYSRDVAPPPVAIFLLGWTIFTLMMWLGTLRANIALSTLFAFLTITFMLLSIDFRGPANFKRVSLHHPHSSVVCISSDPTTVFLSLG